MEKIVLDAQERKLVGKKVKQLRRDGLIPANLFGRNVVSVSLQVKSVDFLKVWKKAGETTLVELSVGDGKAKPVFIKAMQKDPVKSQILHIDFQQVNLKEKTTAPVPLVLEGESPVEKSGDGLILQTLSEVEVEALPIDIPHDIKIDISRLIEVGQTIHVKDLLVSKEVEIKADPEAVILSVQTAEMKEEAVEEAAPGEPEVITEKPEEETAEGGEQAKEAS